MSEYSNVDSSIISDSSEHQQINQNIEAVLDFYARENDRMSLSQRILERISCFIGEPIFLVLTLLFVSSWIVGNLLVNHVLAIEFDPPPFHFLQGIIGLSALLTASIVLSNQNRLAKLEEQRAHLDLKVNLLTEQKTAKMIEMLDELRFDLPNVRNRTDTEATQLKHAMNPDQVLAALDERGDSDILRQATPSSQLVDSDGKKL